MWKEKTPPFLKNSTIKKFLPLVLVGILYYSSNFLVGNIHRHAQDHHWERMNIHAQFHNPEGC